MRLRLGLRPASPWGTHDALPNPLGEDTHYQSSPHCRKMTEPIGSASEYGLEYEENAFVKRQKITAGSEVQAAELNSK